MPSCRLPLFARHILAAATTCAAAAIMGLTALVLHAPSAHAQWVSTGELVDSYCASEDPEQAAFCVGYMAGALHVLMAPPELLPQGMFCIDVENQPKLTALAEQLIRIRKEKPELATTPAYTLIAGILERNFPCPEEVVKGATAPNAPQAEETPRLKVFGLED